MIMEFSHILDTLFFFYGKWHIC